MTESHWRDLLRLIKGEKIHPLPSGFIIDSPWLPNWAGMRIVNYFSHDDQWLQANLKAVQTFPEIMFLPGFWSEYGMCTEPSAFGARCTFPANEFPHAHKVIRSSAEIDDLPVPNPGTDGLLPFLLNRLKWAQPRIQDTGHQIRFAVARGPLNIASYLMGSSEFMMLLMMEPDKAHLLIRKITDFLKSWLTLQRETISTIDGILLLDDIIGFIGEEEFKTFGLPYFKELYDTDVTVKFLHNDAACAVSAPYLPEIGINLFNMGFDTDLNQLKSVTENKVVMLGNIPPRDVLAAGTPEDVQKAVTELAKELESSRMVLFSCGGGMPPGVDTENIRAFLDALKTVS